MKQTHLSVLELAIVTQDHTISSAIEGAVATARHAEATGYTRIWLAEHHNMEHIASSATAVLIGHIAGQTRSIRVGSGGIMLPNHSPLAVAEQFGTLETLYPGRIDLGLGRTPGTDPLTAMALRRNDLSSATQFPSDIREIQAYLSADNHRAKVRAFPGEGLDIPLWILGSSTDSAYLAAEMGLPYAFAAHFAPVQLLPAIDIYRRHFKPSPSCARPYVLACVNVIAAKTDAEAELLATSLYRMFFGLLTDQRMPLQPPGALPDIFWKPEVQAQVRKMTACTFTGARERLKRELSAFIKETQADEIMVCSHIYDLSAKLESLSITAGVLQD